MKNRLINFFFLLILKIYLDIKFFINNFSNPNKNYYKKKYIDYKNNNSNYFFGYHDKISLQNNKLLSHENFKNEFYVGYFNKKKLFKRIKKTNLCSWQLGSQLQWIDKNKIIFNGVIENKPCSILFDLRKMKILKRFNHLIYNFDKNKRNFISLNFNQLYENRSGYGYNLKKYNNFNINSDDLKIIKLKNDKILHSIKKNTLINKFGNLVSKHSHFNHANFSPSGKSILFFLVDTFNQKRKILLFHFKLKSKKITFIEKIENISHYCLIDDKKILFTQLQNNGISKYKTYDIQKKKIDEIKLNLSLDGHPMVNPKNSDLFVTDTYPDKYGYQKLFVFDLKKNKIVWKTSLKFSTSFLSGSRCDLHPKWDLKGNKIVIDYAIKKQRFIRVYDFEI